ncbi:hypothetical protein A2960_02405 [Candidatus Gottesmanbacteria bacterium RIFCSPLOWO2_01_FULL_39_12b]|uniref:Type II secretion system protein GspG C-terminal domain-containing protein n=1 Tax=Candidatus Gottesmanbacteria bacterium RIFCSPLOWO2_01_FULL_39_12b TaxID=1798388 RepID=A0A1F6AQK8_9BACT|nr:MAG: hypothetical protein A2960_02405 [Candidatus Gottesmanbacteria bacterium RIFCSPLOWO2_01_FULL_39_12b]
MKIKNLKLKIAHGGFTMIELLIVIAVLGVLAVAVISAINPIEQINRSYDTGSRSDAEQLIGAVDRFYANNQYYPWQTGATDTNALGNLTVIDPTTSGVDPIGRILNTLSGSTSELKSAYITKIQGSTYNYLRIYNLGDQGSSTYTCFGPKSSAFKLQASQRCGGVTGPNLPTDLSSAAKAIICAANAELSCLP